MRSILILSTVLSLASGFVRGGRIGSSHNNHTSGNDGSKSSGASDCETSSVYDLGDTATIPFIEGAGGVKSYNMILTYGNASGDGYVFDQAILVNGQFPAPALVATEGDTVSIKVINNLNQPTTVHWHGMFQYGTPYLDGNEWTSQCAIPIGQSFVYTFNLNQSGTYWYHSHAGAQYQQGLRGPFIIMPKKDVSISSGAIDRVITLADWYHNNGSSLLAYFFDGVNNPSGNEPVPDSGLMNGKGQFNCTGLVKSGLIASNSVCTSDQYTELKVNANERYRIRLINMSAFTTFIFQIQGIKLYVIELDGTSYEPTPVDSVTVDIAQRVSIYLAPGDQKIPQGTYVMNATMQSQYYPLVNPVLNTNVLGYLVIGQGNQIVTTPASNPLLLDSDGYIVDANNAMVSYPITLARTPALDITSPTQAKRYMFQFRFDNDKTTNLNFAFGWFYYNVNGAWVQKWGPSSWQPDNVTAIERAIDGAQTGNLVTQTGFGNFPIQWNTVPVDLGDVIEMTFVNHEAVPHPFHWHGHNAQIVGRGRLQQVNGIDVLPSLSDIDAGIANTTKLNLPPIRDVAMSQPGGWLTIRFFANNPGAWAIHCHMEWHLAAGKLMTIIEGQPSLAKMSLPTEWKNLCQENKAQGLLPSPAGTSPRVSLNYS